MITGHDGDIVPVMAANSQYDILMSRSTKYTLDLLVPLRPCRNSQANRLEDCPRVREDKFKRQYCMVDPKP